MIGRLRGRDSFARLRREGTRVRSGVLLLTMVTDPTLARPHVGFAVGRAIGSAVVRNRLRRRLRALVRDRAGSIPPGLYLISCTPAAAERSFAQLGADLDVGLEHLARRGR